MDNIFDVSECTIIQIISETNRFLFHISLVTIVTAILDGKTDVFNESFFKTLLVTALAIILYNIIFKKITEPKIKKMKKLCNKKKE